MCDERILQLVGIMDELNLIKNGPVKLMDFFPVLIPLIPKFVKNSWMKMQRVDELLSNLKNFMEVSKIFLFFSNKGVFPKIWGHPAYTA